MEIFFSTESKLSDYDYFKIDEINYQLDEIVLEAKFYDLPVECHNWRGFKGRVISETINDLQSNCLYYKKLSLREVS